MLWTSVKLQSDAGAFSTKDISLLCFARKSLLYYGIFKCFNRFSRTIHCSSVSVWSRTKDVRQMGQMRSRFGSGPLSAASLHVNSLKAIVGEIWRKGSCLKCVFLSGSPIQSVGILFKSQLKTSLCHLTSQHSLKPLLTPEANSQHLSKTLSSLLYFTNGYIPSVSMVTPHHLSLCQLLKDTMEAIHPFFFSSFLHTLYL